MAFFVDYDGELCQYFYVNPLNLDVYIFIIFDFMTIYSVKFAPIALNMGYAIFLAWRVIWVIIIYPYCFLYNITISIPEYDRFALPYWYFCSLIQHSGILTESPHQTLLLHHKFRGKRAL